MKSLASGTILVNRFVKVSGSNTVAQQTVAGDPCIGSSQDGGRYAPIPTNTADPVEAAQSGEAVTIHTMMDAADAFPNIVLGTGGITAGQNIMSDANGKGVLATTGNYVQGIALATGSAGDVVPYFPTIFQLN